MKTFSFISLLTAAGAASSILLPAFDAAGQTTVATAPVGYLQTSCLSNSDTLVAPPFTRPAAFTGAVSSISSTSTTATVTLNSTSLTADAYDAPTTTPPTKDGYYLSIGPATATLAGTVSVTSGSTTVIGTGTTFGTDVKVGDRITINDGVNLLTYTVTAIASTSTPQTLTIDRAFSDSAATGGTSAITPVAATTASKGGRMLITSKMVTNAGSPTLSGLSATYDHSPYEGRTYQIISNATGTVTVNLNGDSLSSVASGTQVSVVPYWTLNAIYPSGNEKASFTPSGSSLSRRTQIIIPNYSGTGTDLAASATYYFIDSTLGGNPNNPNIGWRLFGDSSTVDHGYDPLLPDGYYIVRNDSNSPTLPVTFSGSVPVNKQAVVLATTTTGAQDNEVGLVRPADTTLGALGLSPSDNSFRASTSSLNRIDQLFVYSNAQTAMDKVPSATYYYINNNGNVGWRLFGDSSSADHGPDVIPAGSALTIRKSIATGAAQNPVWTNSPNY